jgi:hypothetical protein
MCRKLNELPQFYFWSSKFLPLFCFCFCILAGGYLTLVLFLSSSNPNIAVKFSSTIQAIQFYDIAQFFCLSFNSTILLLETWKFIKWTAFIQTMLQTWWSLDHTLHKDTTNFGSNYILDEGRCNTPSQNDGVNQDHVEGFSAKWEFTSTCIQVIIIVFWI